MRPIKLTMSAFGSYSGMETIDFTKIQGGLFLVTGDTGAGKTTIFDAVTYALYDRTSGGRRDGNMMRSQYADDEAETFVEYTFAYRDGQYTIRRNPEYMRAGKRKNADGKIRLVKETSKVSLIMPDGKEFQGKKREVDQKIEQIIGLDAGRLPAAAACGIKRAKEDIFQDFSDADIQRRPGTIKRARKSIVYTVKRK